MPDNNHHVEEKEQGHITRAYTTALMFEQNIMIALGEVDINTAPLHKVDARPKKEPRKRLYIRECKYQKCMMMYETEHSRVKFCSKKCCVYHHKEQYEKRKKINPAKYQAMKRKKNLEWGDYIYRVRSAPPDHQGRPTKIKQRDLQDFRNELRRNARERLWKKRQTTSQPDGGDVEK